MKTRNENLWFAIAFLTAACGGEADDARHDADDSNAMVVAAHSTNGSVTGDGADRCDGTNNATNDRPPQDTNNRPPQDTNNRPPQETNNASGDTNNNTGGDTNNGTAGGTNNGTGGETDPPSGGDTDQPVAIDTGSNPSTPGSYKGLPLALTDNGAPNVTAVQGKIGVVCIGMSNGSQECDAYLDKLARGWKDDIADEVVVVNCAVGGNAIERWNDPANDGNLWDACKNQKLPAAGLSVDQVRVVWHKAANQFPDVSYYPASDADYYAFYDNLAAFSQRVTTEFPSIQAVYSSSRSYGGFTSRADRGEPISYEQGHALNAWLADNPNGVNGVWFGWGPYLWAPDCATGETNGSGVCYVRSDFQSDGIHPANGGKEKISEMLHERLLRESWFAR